MADKKIVAGIGSVLVVGIALTIALIAGSVHVVQQGTVGIYFVNGRLADTLAFPGDYNEKVARYFLMDASLTRLLLQEIIHKKSVGKAVNLNFLNSQLIFNVYFLARTYWERP